MKYFLIILFFAICIGIGLGFYIKSTDPATGDIVIGLSLMAGIFILMPAFIYHRWKNKNVEDYMLTKENIMKMQEYRKNEK